MAILKSEKGEEKKKLDTDWASAETEAVDVKKMSHMSNVNSSRMQMSARASLRSGSIYSPRPFVLLLSRFSVKKAIACKCLKNILNRKKGQLFFSIVSCPIKSYHWLVNDV